MIALPVAIPRRLTHRRRTTLAAALAVVAVVGAISAAAGSGGPGPPPPAGLLSIDGGEPIEGEPGGYCIDTRDGFICGDIAVPWIIPKTASPSPAEATLTFRLDGRTITSWSADAVLTAEADSSVDGKPLGGEDDVALESVSFTGPPAGDWVVAVFVTFPPTRTTLPEDACCYATYYFRLRVDMPDTAAADLPQPAPAHHWPLFLLPAAAAGAVLGWRSRRVRGTRSAG